MKRISLMLLLTILLSGCAYCADQTISFTIPEAKVAQAMQGYLKLYPNTEVDPITQQPKYTDAQWIKESIRRNIVNDIRRGLQVIANENAVITGDDSVVQ